MTGLALSSVTELASMLQAGTVSSIELVELYLERIERLNPRVNAVVGVDAEGARAAARAADARRAAGERLGPLHGVPMTVKDTHEVRGLVTTAGNPEWRGHVPERDSDAVARLRRAGAVFLGRTNVPFLAGDMQSYNDVYGQTGNPWNPDRVPGGSSGGAAAAVALGLTSCELGSDIGGSIRHPAHWCGVFGHKPSYGIVPQRGHIPPGPGALAPPDLNVIGPLARDPRDLGLLLDVLSGPDDADAVAWKLALPPPRREELTDFRVAAWIDDETSRVDAPVRERLEAAIAALRAAGVRVDDRARPDLTVGAAARLFLELLVPVIFAGYPRAVLDGLESMAASAPAEDRSELTELARRAVTRHGRWIGKNERRFRHRAAWAEFFRSYDVILCPVNAKTAIPHDHMDPLVLRTIDVNGAKAPYTSLMDWVGMITLAYLPSTVVPVGLASDGLPVGMQIVAPYLEDRTSLEFARLVAPIVGGYRPPPGA